MKLFNLSSAHLFGVAFGLGLTLLHTSLAFAEGAGGGALGGKGGSGPEPGAMALLAMATGVGAIVARKRRTSSEVNELNEEER